MPGWHIRDVRSNRCIAPNRLDTTTRNVTVYLSREPCRLKRWFDPVPGTAFYNIRLQDNTSRCLVPSGSSGTIGVKLVTGACSGSPPRQFQWLPTYYLTMGSRDYYTLRNVQTGYCMAAANQGTAQGTQIVQHSCGVENIWTW